MRSDENSLFHHDHTVRESFAVLQYPIRVTGSGNALSIVATYPFASMVATMVLIDTSTNNVVKVETTASLEGNERVTPFIQRTTDMASYIEVPAID